MQLVSSLLGVLVSMLVASAATAPPLEIVDTKVRRVEYCAGDSEMFSVLLDVRMAVRNTSDKTLILPRNVFVPVSRISSDLAAAQRGEYDYESGGMEIGPGSLPPPSIPRRPDPRQFALLPPGKVITLTAKQALPARYKGIEPLPNTVEAGDTPAVRLLLRFWPALENPDRLQEAWKDIGQLVTEPIWTQPLSVQLPVKPRTKKCN